MGNRGKREVIQALRLMEAMPRDVVADAVMQACIGAIRLAWLGLTTPRSNAWV